jgi:sugar lactone lactonase YvrE
MKKTLFTLLALLPLLAAAQPGIIRTVAGNGSYASCGDSLLADSACLRPYGIAVDRHGNVFVADNYFNNIRKFREGDTIYTAVGNGYPGYSGDGGPASAATLSSPTSLAFDTAGNLYIADAANYVVRKINTHDTITTVAGNHTSGFYSCTACTAISAKVGVSGVAADNRGNFYVADGNTRIWKVDTGGIINLIVGNGSVGYSGDGGAALSAALDGPVAVCVDGAGNIYFADKNNNVIRKVNTSGIITRFAGTTVAGFAGDNGPATNAKLNGPNDVKVDAAGNVYIADQNNNRIRKIDASTGIITTIAGSSSSAAFSGDGGPATSAGLAFPTAIWLDDTLNLYIADRNNSRVRKVGHPAWATLGNATLTEGAGGISVYPNPSTGTFIVGIENPTGDCTLEIFNALGAKVHSQLLNSALTEITLNQPPGIYFIKARTAQKTSSQILSIGQGR